MVNCNAYSQEQETGVEDRLGFAVLAVLAAAFACAWAFLV
jgi:hypothetical protein